MFERECNTLTSHLDAKKAAGLVDIKFYVNRRHGMPDPHVVCEETNELFDAVAKGQVEQFRFNDRHEAAA